jgi:hypothetical protein
VQRSGQQGRASEGTPRTLSTLPSSPDRTAIDHTAAPLEALPCVYMHGWNGHLSVPSEGGDVGAVSVREEAEVAQSRQARSVRGWTLVHRPHGHEDAFLEACQP